MKTIFAVILFCLAAHAAVINSNRSEELIKILQSTLDELNSNKKEMHDNINIFKRDLKKNTEKNNGAVGENCFNTLIPAFEQKVKNMLDECVDGHIRATITLMNDIKNGKIHENYFEILKKKISEGGSFYEEREDSLYDLVDKLKAAEKEIYDSVHKQCWKPE